MADNYLEKKYEEYKSRKEGRTNHPYNGRKTTVIHKTRRVFVTGGAEGIGKAIVRAFRSAGHRVAFCDRNEAAGKETALQTGTSFFHVDVSDQEALENCMQQIFKEWGDIDIIINNAGISCFSPITETGVEDFDRILSVNLRPVFITSRRDYEIRRFYYGMADSRMSYTRIFLWRKLWKRERKTQFMNLMARYL